MANSFDSNVTRKLVRSFLKSFEASRVLCKAVDTQLLDGRFNPTSGTTVDVKRPHDYTTARTDAGDISSSGKSDIQSGKATATVQQFFTVGADFNSIDEALKLDQLDEIIAPMATRMVTDLELDLGTYMMKNGNLSYGTPGTAIDAWSDISGAGALMDSVGVPKDKPWHYIINPYQAQALAQVQYGLSPGSSNKVDTAWERARVSDNVGGMRVSTSNALPTRTCMTAADKTGALQSAPTLTYLGAKDTMTQDWLVTGFSNSSTVKAGDIIEVTGKYRASSATREAVFNAGAQVKFRGTVTADVTLDGSGEGTINIAGAAIWESGGAYNTTTAALATDVITVLGATGISVQPALFFHPQAFGLATVKLPKLYSTDTVATTSDGFSIRCSKYADGDANQQTVRFDLLPAYATFNPFFAGQGFGV